MPRSKINLITLTENKNGQKPRALNKLKRIGLK